MFQRAVRAEGPAIVFARNFFKNPRMLGSLIPSSRFLVEQLLRNVRWNDTKVIVEYGPGVGTISEHILRRMRPDAVLVAFEINDDFVSVLTQRIHDRRFHVVQRSAEDVQDVLSSMGVGPADVAISGIPFSMMTEESRRAVLRNTYEALKPGGSLLVYQFSARVKTDLEQLFGSVRQQFEPRNILPARVFHCVKK